MNKLATIQRMAGRGPRSLAVVGLSAEETKPSHYVSAYMQRQGWRIWPINPLLAEHGESVLGEIAHASLSALPVRPDIVNVFRLPKAIPAIVDEMLALGLTDLWVQQGIVNLDAARTAEAGGIQVVMDRCLMVEHRRLRQGQ